MAPLAALGWRVVAPDMRGYGDSSTPTGPSAYRIEHLVADVAALFDALGARRRLLIGHDWGAAVAWAFALAQERPDATHRLDGLVVMNVPHPKVFRDVLKASPAQRKRSWYIGFFQVPWLPEKLLTARGAWAIGRLILNSARDKRAFPPEILDSYRAGALRPGGMTAMLNYYRANIGAFKRAGPVPKINVPTLMIWGEADTALGLELTEGYGPLVTDFTLARLPGVSHWVQQEAPEAVNARLTEWLETKPITT
jgi:pimeloyl-ACP methyl ester carboxylesterase